ncbi:unnamed protein product, partial [Brenthis ino]
MELAVTRVGVERIRCMAHSLQLVLKDAFSGEEKINEMITKARSIIGHFSHSTSGRKILTEMQKSHNVPCHVLIQDVSTRWDSTLHALRRLLEQRVAVQASLPHVKCRTELATKEWESPNSTEAPRQNQNQIFSGIWSACDSLIKEAEDDEPLSNMSIQREQEEVESYLRFPNIPIKQDPKIYWRQEDKYPKLKKLAQKYLSYPMSSVASERLSLNCRPNTK